MAEQRKAPVAVWPRAGRVVHIYVEGYRTQKPRSVIVDTALCGVTVNETTPPPVGPSPTGRKHVSIESARKWIDRPEPEGLPEFITWGPFRWCANCVGRAAEVYGGTDAVIDRVQEADRG